MATIENLGAAYSNRITRQSKSDELALHLKRVKREVTVNIPTTKRAAEIRRSEEARNTREPSAGRGRAMERSTEQTKRMTLEEFAEVLRKVNLTFDMFEIQARFTIDSNSGDISIEVINQRTGEVIRKIPPYYVTGFAEALKEGKVAGTDILA